MVRELCAAAIWNSGQRCGRRARPGSRYCGLHQHAVPKGPVPVKAVIMPTSYPALEAEPPAHWIRAAPSPGLDDEIAILRTLIRKAADAEDLAEARKGIDTLCRALKAQVAIRGASGDGYVAMLNRALDEVSEELGVEL